MCFTGECPFEKWDGNCSIPGGRKPPGAACQELDEQEWEIELERKCYRAMRLPNIHKPNYLNPKIHHKGTRING